VTFVDSHISEVALSGQRIWKFFGNRLLEAHKTKTQWPLVHERTISD
jgi:hypothetical protein